MTEHCDIRTIIFDLGGVYFTDGAKEFGKALHAQYGVALAQLLEVLDGPLGRDYRTGAIPAAQFWDSAKKQWGLSVADGVLESLWFDGYVPIHGTVKIVEALHKAGYEVLFLSDNAPDRIAYLEQKYGFIGKFDGGIFSHIVKVRKPDPKIYEAVLDIASHPAAQCVFIDDKEKNLPQAQAMGMQTIVFESPEQLSEELRKRGVVF